MEIEQKPVSVWKEARNDCPDGEPENVPDGGSRDRVIPGLLYALLFPVLVGALILSCLFPRRREAGVFDSHGWGLAEIVVGALTVGGMVLIVVILLVILALHFRSARAAEATMRTPIRWRVR